MTESENTVTSPDADATRASARAVLRAVAAHPGLWFAALRQTFRLACPDWWKTFPPVPLPDPDLWRFRMTTLYGGTGRAVLSPEEIRDYLDWSRGMRRWRRV
jgi:hypothetical protein